MRQTLTREEAPTRDEIASDNAFAPDDDLTEREHALFKAWKEANSGFDDQPAFEQRLLQACLGPDAQSLADFTPRTDPTWLELLAEAADECRQEERERAERAQRAQRERRIGDFRRIAQRHEAGLRGAALRLAGDNDLANDLVQETLKRALQHFDHFTQGTNANAWLTQILSNLYVDYKRREHVVANAERRLAIADASDDIEASDDIDRTFIEIPKDVLWDAVSALDAELRDVIELRYRQQLSYKQIADKLNLPIGTVSTRLRRAMLRLRATLKSRAA